MKNIVGFLVLFLIAKHTLAQTIVSDSKGNSVFTSYKAGSFSQEIESAKDEITFTYAQPLASYYNHLRGKPAQKTIAKSYAVIVKVKAANNSEKIDFAKLNKLRLSTEYELGFQKTLDKFYNIRIIPKSDVVLVWGISGFIKVGNFLHYDPLTLTATRQKKPTYGLRGNFAAYKYRLFATQISGSLSWGWNDGDLQDFVSGTPIYNNGGYVVYKDPEKGKLGQLTQQQQYVFSLTNPFFPIGADVYLGRLFIAPYISLVGNSDKGMSTYPGFMLGLLGNRVKGKDYSIDKGFGIGMDWKNGSDASFFVRGTFNIGQVREEKRKADTSPISRFW